MASKVLLFKQFLTYTVTKSPFKNCLEGALNLKVQSVYEIPTHWEFKLSIPMLAVLLRPFISQITF